MLIKIGAQKTQSFSSGMNGQAFEPADEEKGVKHLLTPGAPDFSRGAAHCGDLPRSGGKIFEEFL
jgi:hypothetical protein